METNVYRIIAVIVLFTIVAIVSFTNKKRILQLFGFSIAIFGLLVAINVIKINLDPFPIEEDAERIQPIEKPKVDHAVLVNRLKNYDPVACNKKDAYYEKKMQEYEQAIKSNPYAETYHKLGDAYKEKGNYDEAIKCYGKAIKSDPDYTLPYADMGNAYQEEGNYDEAIKCYEKVIQLDPNYATPYINMGNAYQKKGNYDNAIKSYEKVINLYPDYADTYDKVGKAYQKQGNQNKANEYLQKANMLRRNNNFIASRTGKQ